jgi:hypothetical protein
MEGFIEGFRVFIEEARTAFQNGKEIILDFAESAKSALSDFINITSENFGNFEKMLDSIFDAILKKIADMIAEWLIMQAITGIGNLFTPSAPAGPEAIMVHEGGLIMHEGGIVPRYVPRFHFGGLSSDERPAILQTGERVLDRDQNRIFEMLAELLKGRRENTPAPVQEIHHHNYNISAMDAESFAKFIEKNKGPILKISLDDIRRGGPLSRS